MGKSQPIIPQTENLKSINMGIKSVGRAKGSERSCFREVELKVWRGKRGRKIGAGDQMFCWKSPNHLPLNTDIPFC